MREVSVRWIAIVAVAALLAIPVAGTSYAAQATDISAAKKKNIKKMKPKKEKVEYMRAAPMR